MSDESAVYQRKKLKVQVPLMGVEPTTSQLQARPPLEHRKPNHHSHPYPQPMQSSHSSPPVHLTSVNGLGVFFKASDEIPHINIKIYTV